MSEHFHREPCQMCGKQIEWTGPRPECPYCADKGLPGVEPSSATRREYTVGGKTMTETGEDS